MYRRKRIAVVVPAFNVESRISNTLFNVPNFVDLVIAVNDGSTDRTQEQLLKIQRPGLILIRHLSNRGVGAAITTGYRIALNLGAQVIAVMAGDGQMNSGDLVNVINPVIIGEADYSKGNRFLLPDVWKVMPKIRILGNVVLSLLTKITSGYWRLFDSQCGYTAISSRALHAIGAKAFSNYGYPNELLARLKTVGARVVDVPVRSIYDGQSSGIRIWTVFYPILFVLFRSMLHRIWRKRHRPFHRCQASSRLDYADRTADHFLPAPPR